MNRIRIHSHHDDVLWLRLAQELDIKPLDGGAAWGRWALAVCPCSRVGIGTGAAWPLLHCFQFPSPVVCTRTEVHRCQRARISSI